MSGGRWQYKWHSVELDGNTVQVRSLTAGERAEFFRLTKSMRAGELSPAELPVKIAKMVTKDVTDEDFEAMPLDLLGEIMDKAMQLSGMGKDDQGDAEPAAETQEKKA